MAGSGTEMSPSGQPGTWRLLARHVREEPLALAALIFLGVVVAAAVLAGPITDAFAHPPNAQFPEKLDPCSGRRPARTATSSSASTRSDRTCSRGCCTALASR